MTYTPRQLVALDRTRLSPRSAVPRTAGIVAATVAGLLLAGPADAAVMAIGAWVAGLADMGGSRRRAVPYVALTSLAVAVGGVLGRITDFSDVVAIAAIGAWSFGCASLARFDRPGSALGLLATYGFVLSSTGFTDVDGALDHAGLLLAGGVIQVALILVSPLARTEPRLEPLVLYSGVPRHAFRIALAMMLALAVTRMPVFGEHSYWVATAALFVMRPGIDHVVPSVLARLLGTAAAVLVATLLVAALEPDDALLVALVALAGYGSFLCFSASFALFTAASGALLIVLSAFVGLPASDAARDLTFDTAWGGAIALVAYMLVPRPSSSGSS